MEIPCDKQACVSNCNSDGSDGRDGRDGADAHESISVQISGFSSLRNSFNMHSGRAARVAGGAALGLIVTALLVQATACGRVVATVRSEAAMGIIKESTCENPHPSQNFKGRNMLDHPIETSNSWDCSEKCSELDGCLGWSFVWGSHHCWPKDTIESDMYDDESVDSCLHEAAESHAPNHGDRGEAPSQGDQVEAPNEGDQGEEPKQEDQGVSLFCWSMMQADGYEPNLLRRMFERDAGIFACDTYALFCTDAVELLPGVNAIHVDAAYVGVSKHLSMANTEQFMKVWDGVKNTGSLYNADWTVKVDPDCVFLPWKLRPKLAAHNGEYAFVRNCNAYGRPIVQGAIEVLSQSAVSAFADRRDECRNLLVENWGEDIFITKCLEQLGVQPIDDMSVLTDGICLKSLAPPSKRPPPDNCQRDWVAAFHPFKDLNAWETCLDQAMNAQ